MAALNRLAVAVALLAAAVLCSAQDSQLAPSHPNKTNAEEPRGSVTGTVYCSDTNMPARMARIFLVPASDKMEGHRQFATTDLEGRFAIGHVREGKYYLSAAYSGYLNPLENSDLQRVAAMSPEARKEFESHLSLVTVNANKPAESALRLERAGEIDGTVLFDDGSPAVMLHVEIKPKQAAKDGEAPAGRVISMMEYAGEYQRTTDDRGRFRILGVAPGEYLVSVAVPTASAANGAADNFISMIESSQVGSLVVYPGGVLRASKARPVKIGRGNETADVEITIPLSSLHTVRGHVVLKSTGQPPPTAAVLLRYADTHEVARVGVAVDGEFRFSYVPEDSYILQAAGSDQAMPKITMEVEDSSSLFTAASFDPDAGVMKGAVEVPLQVSGDIEDATIAVPDPPAQAPAEESESENESGLQQVVPE